MCFPLLIIHMKSLQHVIVFHLFFFLLFPYLIHHYSISFFNMCKLSQDELTFQNVLLILVCRTKFELNEFTLNYGCEKTVFFI